MLALFSSIGDLFETSKTYSEKEQVGEKLELFYVLSKQATTNICGAFFSSLLSYCGEDVDLKVKDLS